MANKGGYTGELELQNFFLGEEFYSFTTTRVEGFAGSFQSTYADSEHPAISVRYPEPVNADKDYEFVYTAKGQGFDYYSAHDKAQHDIIGTVKVTAKRSGTQQTLTFEGEYEYNYQKYMVKGTAHSKYTP